MRGYLAFTKKEFIEVLRTYKLLIMSGVFILLGMMNPLTAKLTPVLLKSFLPEGMTISITEPTALDSWIQFYKNVPQMGLLVLVIIFSGIMANECTKGTLLPILTKGLSRKTVIFSKFTMMASVWTVSYFLCFLISYAYTAYFWPHDKMNHLVFSVFCLWEFGVLLLAVIMLGGLLSKSNYGSLLVTGIFIVLLFLLNWNPKIEQNSPLNLVSKNTSLLMRQMEISDFTGSLISSCLLLVLFLIITVFIFNKKQI